MADETASTTTSTEATTTAATADAGAATEAVETTALGGAGEETTAEAEAAKAAGAEAEGAKEGEAAKEGENEGEAKAGPPETYELTMPEGVTLDKASLDAAAPVFRDLGLSQEDAQKLVPVAADFAKRIQDGFNQQIISQVAADRKAWLDTAKADPEIGAGNWDKTLATAAQGLDRLGFPKGSPLRVLLDESGLGNHPDMIRAWARVGKAVGEDSEFVRSEQGGTAKKSDAELFYPAFVKRPE